MPAACTAIGIVLGIPARRDGQDAGAGKFASRITFAGMDALNTTMPIVLRLRRSAPSLLHDSGFDANDPVAERRRSFGAGSPWSGPALRIVIGDRRGVGNGYGESQSVMLRDPITKVAFLHIPKTAGISIIDAFRRRLGLDNCSAFSNVDISEESSRHKRFVSGHVYFGDIRTDAFTFTFLREPLKQIASHLMWIDHYNLPDYRHEASHFHSSIKTAIDRLARTDFSDARSIDQCLEGLPSDSDWMINLQSKHLAFCRHNILPLDHRELAAAAISNLSRIAFTGLTERLSADVANLFHILDLGDAPTVLHLNQSPAARKIDLSEPNIRRVLSKYVAADVRLYDHVVSSPKH